MPLPKIDERLLERLWSARDALAREDKKLSEVDLLPEHPTRDAIRDGINALGLAINALSLIAKK